MIRFPTSLEQALPHASTHDVRAGGTDLQDRRHLGITRRPILDLRDLPGLDQIEPHEGGVRVGALVRLQDLADAEVIRARYPAIAEGAGNLANPQIRAVATIGGNLLQAPRCWYYRHPHQRCLKRGGEACLARGGDHVWHVCFDDGGCAAPHASTMAMILMAYDAEVDVAGGPPRAVEALYQTGGDPTRDHALEPGALLTHARLPAPWSSERAAYLRATGRARAEWPLVEVVARLRLDSSGVIADARVAAGAVANAPLRLRAVEAQLVGKPALEATFEQAARLASEGARPLPQTGYKLELLRVSVVDALTRAAERSPTAVAPPPEPTPPEPAPPKGSARKAARAANKAADKAANKAANKRAGPPSARTPSTPSNEPAAKAPGGSQ